MSALLFFPVLSFPPGPMSSMEKPEWAHVHNLEQCGQYYQGFVDDYESVLSQHCMATYGVRKSRTNAACCENKDEDKENVQRSDKSKVSDH